MLCFHLTMMAQLTRLSDGSYRFEPLLDRLYKVSQIIPQEKVYVHMDNTCYFQGDTIWFAAYTRKTSNDQPSDVSGVLYVELLNNDGYLVERKMIEMQKGRGNGFFALNNQIQYSGFYELRAYTRWQLNWGCFEHKHSRISSEWFLYKELEKNFYRDYEKLYSRVFPVYDRPREPGNYTHDMTLRALRRTFKKDMDEKERELTLTLYPEGGDLVAGIPNRVAFEATMRDGEWLTGTAPHPSSPEGEVIKTVSRGRGVFTIVPEKGMEREVTFTTTDGRRVTARLPKPEERGVALQVRQEGDSTRIMMHLAGLSPDSLGMTIMHEGRVETFYALSNYADTSGIKPLPIGEAAERAGVHQVTVFDTEGHVWADRLFFVTRPEEMQPTLTVSGAKEEYQPYDSIGLDIQGKAGEATVSLTVRDGYQADALYDNASILTEMLLSSEIRGFVPDPGWFFEADDSLHRAALDLLMMTQGWRRFNWRDMAVKDEWELTQPDERYAPIVVGKVYPYTGSIVNGVEDINSLYSELLSPIEQLELERVRREMQRGDISGQEREELKELMDKLVEELRFIRENNEKETGEKLASVRGKDVPKQTKNEVLVHAELVSESTLQPIIGETETKKRGFRLQLPTFYGRNIFFLAASDSTKWKDGKKYVWTQMLEKNSVLVGKARRSLHVDDAEFSVRIMQPYPRFVKPYSYYQQHVSERKDTRGLEAKQLADGTHQMEEVLVRTQRNAMRRFDDSQPALILDYYEALNISYDAGLPLARALFGDYGLDYPYVTPDEKSSETADRIYRVWGLSSTQRLEEPYCNIPMDSLYAPKYLKVNGLNAPHDALSANYFDRVIVYTDYCPRLEGSKRYQGNNLPETRIAIFPYYDQTMRSIYRDRCYILDGFAASAEFYSPDYSRQTQIQVDAAGQARDGTLLWNR